MVWLRGFMMDRKSTTEGYLRRRFGVDASFIILVNMKRMTFRGNQKKTSQKIIHANAHFAFESPR